MGRSKWSPQSNRSNFNEMRRKKDKAKKLASIRKEAAEQRDYAYFRKHGTYRGGGDYCRSLKEEALYKYFCYV